MDEAQEKDCLLLCASAADASDLAGAVLAAAGQLHGLDTEVATRMPPDSLPALAHVSKPDPELPEAILTLRGGAEAIAAALPQAMQTLAPQIDLDGSRLLVTRRHAVLPGSNSIRLFFGLRRLPHMTLEAFQDYWLHHHAEIGRRLIPPYTYHQLHSDPALTAELAETAGLPPSTLDGVVEVHFPDVEAFVAQLSRAEVAGEALEDERNFIDHSRSIFWAYQTR